MRLNQVTVSFDHLESESENTFGMEMIVGPGLTLLDFLTSVTDPAVREQTYPLLIEDLNLMSTFSNLWVSNAVYLELDKGSVDHVVYVNPRLGLLDVYVKSKAREAYTKSFIGVDPSLKELVHQLHGNGDLIVQELDSSFDMSELLDKVGSVVPLVVWAGFTNDQVHWHQLDALVSQIEDACGTLILEGGDSFDSPDAFSHYFHHASLLYAGSMRTTSGDRHMAIGAF